MPCIPTSEVSRAYPPRVWKTNCPSDATHWIGRAKVDKGQGITVITMFKMPFIPPSEESRAHPPRVWNRHRPSDAMPWIGRAKVEKGQGIMVNTVFYCRLDVYQRDPGLVPRVCGIHIARQMPCLGYKGQRWKRGRK
jgi:hypothetical protein